LPVLGSMWADLWVYRDNIVIFLRDRPRHHFYQKLGYLVLYFRKKCLFKVKVHKNRSRWHWNEDQMSKVTTFFDSMGMIFYSKIIHSIALMPTVKKILNIKIWIFNTSRVLKLLQQSINWKKTPFTVWTWSHWCAQYF
jgi:hypothetical protein